MRKYGAFLVEDERLRAPTRRRSAPSARAHRRPTGVVTQGRQPVGVEVDGQRWRGFPTPSRKLEFYSRTLKDWEWPEHAVPDLHRAATCTGARSTGRAGEMVLLPTFRLPTLIHTRSGNAKWLYEISHTQPALAPPEDAARLGRRRPATC